MQQLPVVHVMERAQGAVLISDTTPIEIVPGQANKTLFLNYLELSWSDLSTNSFMYLTDGSAGFDWWNAQFLSSPNYQPRAYSINFGEYGFALSEGNGLFGRTNNALMDFTVVAVGYWR